MEANQKGQSRSVSFGYAIALDSIPITNLCVEGRGGEGEVATKMNRIGEEIGIAR